MNKPNIILTNGVKFKAAYWEPERVETKGFLWWKKKVTVPGSYKFFMKCESEFSFTHRVFNTIEEARAFLNPPKWTKVEEVAP